MNFIKRLTFFSGGFMIGLFFLMFFLSGKKTSCNYMPNSRVKNDILKKNISFSKLKNKSDSIVILNSISNGDIIFSKSNTSKQKCKEYYFENNSKSNEIWLKINNCKDKAIISDYSIKKIN